MPTWKKLAFETDVILKSIIQAKGDIIVGSAASTPARLGVGTDGQYLRANSGATYGVEWAAVAVSAHASTHLPNGSDPLATGTPVNIGTSNQAGTANSFARSDHVHAHPSGLGANLHHNQVHQLSGSDHSESGLTAGHYLRATGATTFAWQAIQSADLPSGISATKIADGSVDNTEFQYLNGVTSNIQTQLDGKAELIHASQHKSGGSDLIRLNELGTPNGNVSFAGYQALDLVVHNASSAPTAVKGKLYYHSTEDAIYLCTSVT